AGPAHSRDRPAHSPAERNLDAAQRIERSPRRGSRAPTSDAAPCRACSLAATPATLAPSGAARARAVGGDAPPTPATDSVASARSCSLAVQTLMDRRNLIPPSPPLSMLHLQDGVRLPVKVIRDEGYLPVHCFQGVA